MMMLMIHFFSFWLAIFHGILGPRRVSMLN
eukprot:SAG31_NODE_43667_length_266_cov_0.616766_1_plen_29_part_01